MEGWKVEEVLQWLSTLGLDQYQASFKTNAIDGTELLTLTTTDLETSLGISKWCEGLVSYSGCETLSTCWEVFGCETVSKDAGIVTN